MPRVTLYIRNEDMELWRRLANKSKTIHELLNGEELTAETISQQKLRERVEQIVEDKIRELQGGY